MSGAELRALGGSLGGAMGTVAADYVAFLATGPGPGAHEDAKAFAGHHAAARTALAHLEHLIKLVRAASPGADVPDTASLVEAARAGIAATEDEPHDDEA